MASIPNSVAKRAIFEQEFKSVIESRNIWSPVATKLIATAKNIYSPFTSVTAAKAHTQACRVPISPLTVGVDELVLDRYIGNAITDCREELSYANFDIMAHIRADLYASVQKRANELATADFIADATTVGGTVDLSTADAVRRFLIEVATQVTQSSVGVAQRVDGARVVRAPRHGKAFVAAGSEAFVNITSAVAGTVVLSSLRGLEDGNLIETPYGVTVINLGGTEDDPNRLIYGTAGVPVMGYREDQIEVDMGEMVSRTTYDGPSPDLDLDPGDALLAKEWYIYAQTKGRNGIFSNTADLVFTQLAGSNAS